MTTKRFLKILQMVFLLTFVHLAYAQMVGVNTFVNPPFPPYLSEY